MQSILNTIKEHNLISRGDIVGVAVSGGQDSMSLLHFLNNHKDELGIDIIALNVDHSIRPESASDSKFVKDYCEEHGIKFYKFKVDVLSLKNDSKMTLEEAAREARFGIFDNAAGRGLVNKIALAHHLSDQVETILLHILRGSGLLGASGMEYQRGKYIRPMLDTSKQEIIDYIAENKIPFVTDSTNFDSEYSRNFIRLKVLPLIKEKWENAEKTIIKFGKICRQDDEYIKKQMNFNAIIYEDNTAKIPLSYFVYDMPLLKRMIFSVLNKLGINADVESKHIEILIHLAMSGESGAKIDLPNGLKAHKEYLYLTLVKTQKVYQTVEKHVAMYPFKIGETDIENFGKILIEKTNDFTIKEGEYLLDCAKVPAYMIWRTKKTGDMFKPFGSGTKKLKDYLIDKKIPLRLRSNLPVLAGENEIYAVAGIATSDIAKIDKSTKEAFLIKFFAN